jgi:hypothetical protein
MEIKKWIAVTDNLPTEEDYYHVKFEDGTEDEKPFRIRPSKNIHGFMTENKVTHWVDYKVGKELTEIQKVFILEHYFKNEKYAGWMTIATKLLDIGKCTVSGRERMWIGGIGNFIQISDSKYTDCYVYEFDLSLFLKSDFYKTTMNLYLEHLLAKKKAIDDEYNELSSIKPKK